MTASAESPRSEYQRNGVVVLRGVLAPHEVDLLREGIDAVMANPSPRAKVASAPDDPDSSSRTSAPGVIIVLSSR